MGVPRETPSDAKEGVLPANQAASAAKNSLAAAPPGSAPRPDGRDVPTAGSLPGSATAPAETGRPSRLPRRSLLLAGGVVGLAVGGYFLAPSVRTALNTVSTDDAYVNGHVTFVAPRVLGQVSEVLVDYNYRVKKGELLVELDPEPYRVEVAIKKAAVEAAETDLAAAQAQVRGQVAEARANRYKLQHAIEEVNNQIANLRAAVATLNSRNATLVLAERTSSGAKGCFRNGPSAEKISMRSGTYKVAEAESSRRCR